MKIGPKFKIAKRLGAPIFEKCNSQRFALSEARASKTRKRRPGAMSDFKRQLIEKQKMRFSYGISEKQLRRYVDEAVAKSHQPIALLVARLELRLDNTIYRLGLAPTRLAARQIVSHGHVLVNGKRIDVPSHKLSVGDTITLKEKARNSGLYTEFAEKFEPTAVKPWLSFDLKKMQGEVKGIPVYEPAETLFDPEQVLEYYSR